MLKPDPARLTFLFALGEKHGLDRRAAGQGQPAPRRSAALVGRKPAPHKCGRWQRRGKKHHLPRTVAHPRLATGTGRRLDETTAVARECVLNLLNHLIPKSEWWSLDMSFIEAVKETAAGFPASGR